MGKRSDMIHAAKANEIDAMAARAALIAMVKAASNSRIRVTITVKR